MKYRIVLPWPPSELNPNSWAHWSARSKHGRAYKEKAYITALGTQPTSHLKITFHPPDKRRRDLDNMFSSVKYAVDGIAKAWGVDDNDFEFTIKKSSPVKGGKVVIS